MSADDFFVKRYAAELQKTFDPDRVFLTYGAPHEGRLTLASALDAKDAWRDDTYLSIVWLSDPRDLDGTPRPARFVFGVTEVTASAREGAPGEVSMKRAHELERRRTSIGNEPVTEHDPFYVRKGLTCTGAPSWGVVGPRGTRVEVVLGEKVLAKKKPTAGARVLRSGKLTVAGVSIAQLELEVDGWTPFELGLAAHVAAGKKLGMKAPLLYVLVAPSEVEVAGKRPAARPAPAEPTVDEATLLAELASGMKDSAIDSFAPGVRIQSAERMHEHIVLRYEYRGQPSLVRAHCKEPLTTRSLLRQIEDELSRSLGRDLADIADD